MGLEHQEATGQGQVAGEPRPLATGGLLHHLDEHLLAGLEQLGDAGATFFQAQRTEISVVNEPVLFTFANIDEGGVDAGEHIFDGAEVDVADLVAALGHHQLIDTLVGEHCGNAQLLGDDDLLGHGESLFGSVSPASGGRKDGRGERRWTGPMAGQDLSGGSTRRAGDPGGRELQRLDTLLGQGKTVAEDRPTLNPIRGSGLSGSDAYGQRLGGAGITRTRVNAGMTERRVSVKGSASA